MAIILIKDLPQNIELDRQAMVAITGGARMSIRQTHVGRTMFRSARIINYPTRNALADVYGQLAGRAPIKL